MDTDEEDFIPHFIIDPLTSKPLIEIHYSCIVCKARKSEYQWKPTLHELRNNKDHQYYCVTCKMLQKHTRSIPK